MDKKLKTFSVVEYLIDEKDIQAYLTEARKEDNYEYLLTALANAKKASESHNQ